MRLILQEHGYKIIEAENGRGRGKDIPKKPRCR